MKECLHDKIEYVFEHDELLRACLSCGKRFAKDSIELKLAAAEAEIKYLKNIIKYLTKQDVVV